MKLGSAFLLERERRDSAQLALIPRVTNCMNVLDTNIWVYSHDSRDLVKQRCDLIA